MKNNKTQQTMNQETKDSEAKDKAEMPESAKTESDKTESSKNKADSSKGKSQNSAEKAQAAKESEIAQLRGQLEKEHNDYLRLMAEFETFRRRSAEERLNLISSASAETIKGLLPVLDDCERALELLDKSGDEAAKEGTNLIFTKLLGYLKTKGLAVIEAKGSDFDTDFHEAVTQFPAPDESLKGKVIDVVQTGYTLSGKVLRYAKVVVGV
ncbi:MAG: nucleotide exchange factor GrpE [Candidatus Cryptobacteroides sp.]|nr:nucleotide exchange factor GrpE [Candidatus Cryptobacteroides sp.]